MDLIFANGNKLYVKEVRNNQRFIDSITKGYNLNYYQKCILEQKVNRDEGKHKVYGDDFKIEITPKNIVGDCVISIKDYDEDQVFESEVRIDFSKDELDQFISLLQIVKSKM